MTASGHTRQHSEPNPNDWFCGKVALQIDRGNGTSVQVFQTLQDNFTGNSPG
jgi:hypothetical protein